MIPEFAQERRSAATLDPADALYAIAPPVALPDAGGSTQALAASGLELVELPADLLAELLGRPAARRNMSAVTAVAREGWGTTIEARGPPASPEPLVALRRAS